METSRGDAQRRGHSAETGARLRYADPEDMAESMANDFADSLVRHYNDTARCATAAAQRLEAAS